MAPMDCSDGCVPPMLSTIVPVQKEILWLLQDGNEAPSRGERRRQEQTRVWHGPNSTLLQKRREQTRVWQHFTSGQINLYHIGRMLTWNYIYVGVDTWYVGVDTWSRGFVVAEIAMTHSVQATIISWLPIFSGPLLTLWVIFQNYCIKMAKKIANYFGINDDVVDKDLDSEVKHLCEP